MAEYIDKALLLKTINQSPCENGNQCAAQLLHYILNAPAADVAPVKHGRWKIKLLDDYQKYRVTCSICGWVGIDNYDSYDDPSDFNYCPNCGAKMDLENEYNE